MWITLVYFGSIYLIHFEMERLWKQAKDSPSLESAYVEKQLHGLFILIFTLFLISLGWIVFYGWDFKVVDFLELIFSGIAVGLCLTNLVVLYIGRILRSNIIHMSRYSIVYLVLGALSVFGIALVDWVNMQFDTQPETQFVMPVKYTGASRGMFSLRVDSWISSPLTPNSESFLISAKLYRQVAIGDELTVVQKPGFLGIPWVKEWWVMVKVQVPIPPKIQMLPTQIGNDGGLVSEDIKNQTLLR